jgi:hypothetical protein
VNTQHKVKTRETARHLKISHLKKIPKYPPDTRPFHVDTSTFIADVTRRCTGMHHVCLEVEYIKQGIVEVRAIDVRALSDMLKIGAHNKPVMFLLPKDCNRVLIEF